MAKINRCNFSENVALRSGEDSAVEAHQQRLAELTKIGVDQFNIYLMSGDEEATLDVYSGEIIPASASSKR